MTTNPLRDQIIKAQGRVFHNSLIERDSYNEAINTVLAILDAQAPQDEPVAYQVSMSDGRWGTIFHHPDKPLGDHRPLYTNPATAVSLPEDVGGLAQAWDDLKDNIPADHAEAAEALWDMGDKLSDTIEAIAAENARLTEERDEALGKAALNEEWAVESELENTRLRREVARLKAALLPFAEFAKASAFDRLPDETPMTQGSRLARKQVSAGDFKRARAALSPADSKEDRT